MNIEFIKQYSKILVRYSHNIDYMDVVQEVCIKLLNKENIKKNYIRLTCKSALNDIIKKEMTALSMEASAHNTSSLARNTNFLYLPDVEEQIYCKEIGKDFYNWPGKEYKSSEKDRIRMKNNYQRKKDERLQYRN